MSKKITMTLAAVALTGGLLVTGGAAPASAIPNDGTGACNGIQKLELDRGAALTAWIAASDAYNVAFDTYEAATASWISPIAVEWAIIEVEQAYTHLVIARDAFDYADWELQTAVC